MVVMVTTFMAKMPIESVRAEALEEVCLSALSQAVSCTDALVYTVC